MADPTPAGAPASDPAAAAAGGTPAAGTGQAGTPAAGPSVEEIRAQAAAEFAAGLKAATGHGSLSELAAARQAAEAEKLKAQGEFQKLAEQASAERDAYRAQFEAAQVRGAVLAAASGAIDSEVVHALLAGSAQVAPDGAVTIGGKSAAEAVAQLLKDKPYLARPVAGQGSGAGAAAGLAGPATMSARELLALKQSDPAAYTAELKRRASAGVKHG
jgi:hypothetical protein